VWAEGNGRVVQHIIGRGRRAESPLPWHVSLVFGPFAGLRARTGQIMPPWLVKTIFGSIPRPDVLTFLTVAHLSSPRHRAG